MFGVHNGRGKTERFFNATDGDGYINRDGSSIFLSFLFLCTAIAR